MAGNQTTPGSTGGQSFGTAGYGDQVGFAALHLNTPWPSIKRFAGFLMCAEGLFSAYFMLMKPNA